MTSHPIAVFDSGLGGLTVLRALRERLPQEDFFYFADTRFLPYGDRPEVFLRERGVLIAEALVRRGAKALVIACNTATAAAAEAIRAAISVPVVALEPGVKPAVGLTKSGVIGVLATTRTLASERFQRLVGNHANGYRVLAQPCPGLAEAIEAHGPASAEVSALLDTFVAPLAAAAAEGEIRELRRLKAESCLAARIIRGWPRRLPGACRRALFCWIPVSRWHVSWIACWRRGVCWGADMAD